MAEIILVYWRDIPAQVIVKAGRKTARRQLSDRFQTAIDRAAMRAKMRDTDSYLEQWRRTEPVACGDELEREANEAAERLEIDFPDARLEQLVIAGGAEPS